MPLRTITSKFIIEWKISSELSIIDMGNGFSLVKFTKAIDCLKSARRATLVCRRANLQFIKVETKFDLVKERLHFALFWVCTLRLPLEMWN